MQTASKHAGAAAYDFFISFRFAEAELRARQIKELLEARGFTVFLSDERPGSDLQVKIAEAIAHSWVHVILATKTYGLKTNELYSTQQEMNYILKRGRPFPIKMLTTFDESFEVPATELALNAGIMWSVWLENAPMPATLIDDLIGKRDASRVRDFGRKSGFIFCALPLTHPPSSPSPPPS